MGDDCFLILLFYLFYFFSKHDQFIFVTAVLVKLL